MKIEVSPALLEKYRTSAPRYTSYPTAIDWSPEFEEEVGERAGQAPRGQEEELLASLWSRVLGLTHPLLREDDFFALGGHSLLATQLAVRIHEAFGVELALQEIFRHPRLEDLAAAARVSRAGVESDGPGANGTLQVRQNKLSPSI